MRKWKSHHAGLMCRLEESGLYVKDLHFRRSLCGEKQNGLERVCDGRRGVVKRLLQEGPRPG